MTSFSALRSSRYIVAYFTRWSKPLPTMHLVHHQGTFLGMTSSNIALEGEIIGRVPHPEGARCPQTPGLTTH
jgi:hypothetical protein